jgi:FeS assembly SUF system protein
MDKKKLEGVVIDVIKTIYDPEIPVDIYELGLIYEIKPNDAMNHIDIDMTLTSPACPVAETMPKEVEDKVKGIEGIETCLVKIVFDPPWDKEMMSEEALVELGMI